MSDHASHMDAIYRVQRHFYDITREPYLLGRNVAIRDLSVPQGGTVLEIACGTARNLLRIARTYPTAQCFGVDISANMLITARQSIERAGAGGRVNIAYADAASFDPYPLFGIKKFDRVVISYALSMIPQWEEVLRSAAHLLTDKGSLHVVDFGDQERLPLWFRKGLFAWLAKFSVTPRETISDRIADIASARGYSYRFRKLYRGYAAIAELSAK